MKNSKIFKLFWIPIFIIGFVLIILGPRWMLVDEPWLLDKVANEETLGISFDKLFSNDINSTLPEYLRTIYRFFGLWVTFIGLLFLNQLLMFDLTKYKSRKMIHGVVGMLLVFSLYLGHTRIPSSPFIYLMWFFVVIYLLSFYASRRMNSTQQIPH